MITKHIKFNNTVLPDYKIIVGLTSWPKRINDIKQTIHSIVHQSYKPDEFYIVLSEKEFPNHETDLPQFILGYVNNYDYVKLIWTKDNLRNFKKNLPLIKKYIDDPKAILCIIDDDTYYKPTYLEYIVTKFIEANKFNKQTITWNFPWEHGLWKNDEPARRLVGGFSIYLASFFKPIVYAVTEDDLETYKYLSEDMWITYNLRQSGIMIKILPYEDLSKRFYYTTIEDQDALRFTHIKYTTAEKTRLLKLCYNSHLKDNSI